MDILSKIKNELFLGYSILSTIVYGFLFFKSREFGILDLHNDKHMLLVVVSLTLLFVGYFLTYFFTNWKKVNIKSIFFITAFFHVGYLFIPFLSSSDLYSYIFSGRVYSVWGANPYLVSYSNFAQDPLYKNLETIWAHHTVLYGPVFLHISGFINLLGQNNLALISLTLKFVLTGANLLNIYLIYKISKSKKAAFLYGLNPLVIYELAGNSHTESLLLLFLLLSFLLMYTRPVLSFGGFALSVLVKYYSALFLPFYLIHLSGKGKRTLALSMMLGLFLTIASYWSFWDGPGIFDYLISYYNGQYISPSLGIYLGELFLGSYTLSFTINTVIFLAVLIFLLYKFWKTQATIKEFVFYSYLLYLAYILTKLSLVLSWYLIPMVALGALCATWKEYQKYALAGIFFVSVYSLGLYYFVR